MAKKDNTIFWIIGIIILVVVIANLQAPKETGMIGLTPHYYKDGVEVFPTRGLFSIVNGEIYDQISFDVYGSNIGNVLITNMQIVDVYIPQDEAFSYSGAPPSDWWGKVIIDGNTGNDGAVVDAYIDGVKVANSVIVGAIQPGYYLIHVDALIEGVEGRLVQFRVNGRNVENGLQDWEPFDNSELDLIADTSSEPIVKKLISNYFPITTKTLNVAETNKLLWTSDLMDTVDFEPISPVNFWVRVSGVNEYTGETVYAEGDSGDITFEAECISHSTYTCYSNDVYWYDSCGVREDKKEECGTSAYTGSNYCYDDDVYRDYIIIGCSDSACTSSTSKIKQAECGVYGCSEGVCNPEPPWIYTEISFVLGGGADSPRGIFRYGGYWSVLATIDNRVYKYDSNWNYIRRDSVESQDDEPEGIYNRAGYWYMIGHERNSVYRYDSNWNYLNRYDVNDEVNYPEDIFWDGSYWWALDSPTHGSYSRVYKYDSNWNYLGISFDLSGTGIPDGFFFDGSYWWVLSSNNIFKYSFPYWTHIETYSVTQGYVDRDIFKYGGYWWKVTNEYGDPKVWKFTG